MASRRIRPFARLPAPVTAAILLVLLSPQGAAAAAGDSTVYHLEIGQRTDITNEQYVDYAELFVDSAFVGAEARLASSPERRYGAFVAAGLAGSGNAGATAFRLESEALIGDVLSTARLGGSWRHETPAGWRWQVDPDAEYRQDQTFDRDREEWRAGLGTRLRRNTADGLWAGELRARGDVLRVSGSATDLLADRQTLSLGSELERIGLLGDLSAAYMIVVRAFPDSASRDHTEHQVEARGRTVLAGGLLVAFDSRLARRQASQPVAISRDEFTAEEAALELGWMPAPAWSATVGLEGEAIQYDRPDSTLYADAQRLRGGLRLQAEPARGATLRLEGVLERTWSRDLPEEEYVEVAGGPGLEWFAAGAWWDVAPRAGRRWRVDESGAVLTYASGYEFYELSVGADQPLGRVIRLRLAASGRIEEHDDPSFDARSLYVSAEFRWYLLGGR